MARGILSKLRRHAPQSVLKCVYYSLVYSYLYYGVTSWGNTATTYTKTIQIQQNYIVKTINNSTSFKTKLMPIYQQLNLMNLCQIYKLEIVKLLFKYKNKTLPNCFKNYFVSPSETHNYPTRFACDDNLASAFQHKKSISKCSIQLNGYKIWNELDGSLRANPVNDRRIANAVTLKVLFVYRKISNYSKISDYSKTSRKMESKYLSVKYLLISKKVEL